MSGDRTAIDQVEQRRCVFDKLILEGTNPPGANIERLGLVKRKGA